MTAELDDWATSMRGEGKATRTVKERLDQLRRAERAGVDLLHADRDSLARFLASNDKWEPATRRAYYSALRAWFTWLQDTDRRADNPTLKLRAPKVPPTDPRSVSNAALGRVIANCPRKRTRAMMLLAAYQGLRVHEIAKIRGEDIRDGRLKVKGKGGRTVYLPLHPQIAELAPHFPEHGYWFPSYARPDEPVTAKNVSTVVGKTLQRAGLEASAHTLRHWFGRETLHSSNGNLRTTQDALRHASPSTTAIYTRVDDADLRAAIEGLPRLEDIA